jgi:uncharacterized protein (TIGR03032 family)
MTETNPPQAAEAEPAGFTSEHTAAFAPILAKLGISLAVSTYQAGPVIHHRNIRSVGRRTEFPDRTDAVYVPRSTHVIGDVRVHEVWYDKAGTTWFVNTLLSCLATVDGEGSFTPQWQPPFVTALAPEDRCHLNGVAVADGQARYVTALGATDSNAEWRANKLNGGVLLDVPSGEIVAQGLSMPHSPRLHGDDLWVLESGHGGVGTVDRATGKITEITRLPGFTRGLAFAGPYAFIGLSQVRETVFAGLPIASQADRSCGVWILDVRTGKTAAFLRFEGIVQEIFDIKVLPHRWPDLLRTNDPIVDSIYVLPDTASPTI